MPFPGTSDFTAPDRDLLAHFLRAVYELLAEVTEVPFDPLKQPLFADELIDPMRGAFSEVRDHFGRLDAAIKEFSSSAGMSGASWSRPSAVINTGAIGTVVARA